MVIIKTTKPYQASAHIKLCASDNIPQIRGQDLRHILAPEIIPLDNSLNYKI
jgi:hypothetical protein